MPCTSENIIVRAGDKITEQKLNIILVLWINCTMVIEKLSGKNILSIVNKICLKFELSAPPASFPPACLSACQKALSHPHQHGHCWLALVTSFSRW